MTGQFALRLCTFEVATPVGRQQRLGAFVDGCIADLNFATAWYMAQTGETEPQRIADALVPADLPTFVRSGLRAVHTAEELFLGAGPAPAQWWAERDTPRGPNDETLVYRPEEVRLLAPMPHMTGPEAEVPAANWRPKLAAIAGSGEVRVLGLVLLSDFGGTQAMGPFVTAPHAVGDPEVVARVNGEECCRFRRTNAAGQAWRPAALPGDVIECACGQECAVNEGDIVEVAADGLGVLRNRITTP